MLRRVLFAILVLLAVRATAQESKTDLPCRFLDPVASCEEIATTYEELLDGSKKNKDEKAATFGALYAEGETFDESVLDHLVLEIDEKTSSGYVPFDALTYGKGKGSIRIRGERDWFQVSAKLCKCRIDGHVYRLRAFVAGLLLETVEWTAGKEKRVDILFTVVTHPVVRAHVLHETGAGAADAAAAVAQEFGLDAQTTLSLLLDVGYSAADAAIAGDETFGMEAETLVSFLAKPRTARTRTTETGVFEFAPPAEAEQVLGFSAADVAAVLVAAYQMSPEEIVTVIASVVGDFAEDAAEALGGVVGYLEDHLGVTTEEVLKLLFQVADSAVVGKALKFAGWTVERVIDAYSGSDLQGALDMVIQAIKDGFEVSWDTAADQLTQVTGIDGAELADALRIVYELPIDETVEFLHDYLALEASEAAAYLVEHFQLDDLAMAIHDKYETTKPQLGEILIGIGASGLETAAILKNVAGATAAEVAAILQDLGHGAAEIADAVRGAFSETAEGVAQILKDLAFDASQIASAIKAVFLEIDTPQELAALLDSLQYAPAVIAAILQDQFNSTASAVAGILDGLGVTVGEIGTVLKDVFGTTASSAASILGNIGASATEIGGILKDTFSQTASQAASILDNLGIPVSQIGTVLKNVFNQTASQAASILNGIGATVSQIVSVLDGIYNSSVGAIVSILGSLGKSIGQIVSALQAIGASVQAIAVALWNSGLFTLGQIQDALNLGFFELMDLLGL